MVSGQVHDEVQQLRAGRQPGDARVDGVPLDGKTFTFDGNNGVFYSCPNPE